MNDHDLDRLLRLWNDPDVPEDGFPRLVWQRIAHGTAAVPRGSGWLDGLLRPRFALTGFAAALIIGTAGGMVHAVFKQNGVAMADGTAAYVQSINPLDPMHLQAGKGSR